MLWLKEIRGAYGKTVSKTILAVHVPKQTEQSPKAVENIFAHLTGLFGGKGNLIDRYWHGKTQDSFSCELVSRGGFIQYYVRLPVKFRDIFEASIFAQYPDSEIVEVTDYTQEVPHHFPDEQYDLWGTELSFAKPSAYPIKTYTAFEDALSGTFKDPLSSLLEFLGTLKIGEEIWIQYVLAPSDEEWHKKSMELVKKMIGQKVDVHKGFFDRFAEGFSLVTKEFFHELSAGILPGPHISEEKKEAPPSLMQYLSPGEKMIIEQIQMKASKPGFKAKIRIVYIGKKELFSKVKAIAGVIGSFKQFSTLHMNSFGIERHSKVGANYFFVKQRIIKRQNKLMKAYVGRALGGGASPYVLNTEELATIWHFPMIDVKAPLISKAQSRRAEPPSGLPMREREEFGAKPIEKHSTPEEKKSDIPENLPFV